MLSDFGLVPTEAVAVIGEDVYDRLTVLYTGQIPNTYKYYAICQCLCGSKPKRIRFDSLIAGHITSCGCYHKEQITTHGLSNSLHYGRWHAMMDRCYNEDCEAYPNYGGRGIAVCKQWHDVANYISALPDGHFKGAHLDRIDNDGDYEPDNVRWLTPKENHNNRRSGVPLTHNGKTQSMTAWAKELNMTPQRIWDRLNTWGWSVQDALTKPALSDAHERMKRAHEFRWAGHTKAPPPPKREFRTVEYMGAAFTLANLSVVCGVSHKLLAKRIFERGWSVEKAVVPPAPK